MALTQCTECKGSVSDQASSCPHCGAPMGRSVDPKDNPNLKYSDAEISVLLDKKKKTNHLLHLILCIPTVGLWVIIWILVALSNGMENGRIDRKIARGK